LPQFSMTHNKIEPIFRFCKTLIGRRRGQRHTTPPFCEMWIGISAEESARRCKPAREAWVTNRYPLRELGMSRADCEAWLLEHYHIVVPKSACTGCLMWKLAAPTRPRRVQLRGHVGPPSAGSHPGGRQTSRGRISGECIAFPPNV
jgi:hypothetical protein